MEKYYTLKLTYQVPWRRSSPPIAFRLLCTWAEVRCPWHFFRYARDTTARILNAIELNWKYLWIDRRVFFVNQFVDKDTFLKTVSHLNASYENINGLNRDIIELFKDILQSPIPQEMKYMIGYFDNKPYYKNHRHT